MKRKRTGSYRPQLSRLNKPVQICESGQTEENLRLLIQGATEDLLEKREADSLGAKDLTALLKLIEGHSRLERLEIERDKLSGGEVDEEAIEALLVKLGIGEQHELGEGTED